MSTPTIPKPPIEVLIPPDSALHYVVTFLSPFFPVILFLSPYRDYFLAHGVLQFIWFTIAAGIPAFFTDVMYWVDFAWPTGLSLISVFTFYWTSTIDDDANVWRRYLSCLCLFLHGLRMAAGATFLIVGGAWTTAKDLPRYQFQKIRLEHHGGTWNQLFMQKEIYMQFFANAGLLCLPCILCSSDTSASSLSLLEIFGYATWVGGWVVESIADGSKLHFMMKNSKKKKEDRAPYCNIGLWKYSRHPNYFGEWTAWNGLAIAAIDPLRRLAIPAASVIIYEDIAIALDSDQIRNGLVLILLFVSLSIYYCLSEWTGAIPAEYFSSQKRVGYVDYQRTTNCIIPWFPLERSNKKKAQ